MATSSATLTSLWVEEGSPTKVSLSTPSKQGEFKEGFERFFRESELGTLAKQADIIDNNGELVLGSSPSSSGLHHNPGSSSTGLTLYVSPPKNQVKTETFMLSTSAGQRLTTVHATPSLASDLSRKRPASTSPFAFDTALDESKRIRKTEKGGKGLRHFSMKVCEKVQRKGVTTYNEVADELVNEFADPRSSLTEQAQYDQKNIRRRVYDALNVLMAMNIISKEKKEIRWIGLPTNSAQECQNLEIDKMRRVERIQHKTQQLQELILQQVAYKNLVQRNRQREQELGAPPSNATIQLPFIIVNTNKKTVIDCSISSDKSEYLFDFNDTFEIHDDIEVLKRMGLACGLERGRCSAADLDRVIDMLPKSLESHVRNLARDGTTNKAITAPPSAISTLRNGLANNHPAQTVHPADIFSEESNQSVNSNAFPDLG